MSASPVNSSLQSALAEAEERYVARNPRSRAAHHEATGVLPGGNTRTVLFHTPFPLTMARGADCRLWDVDGHEYLDLLGEFTAGLYGHSHPVIRAALDAALDRGWNLGAHGQDEARLARLLVERFPSVEMVRFTNSGTEANVLALAAAKVATGRTTILAMRGGYHGGVLTFAGGGSPINLPHRFVLAEYNDVPGAVALARAHAGDLAAIILEPMLGGGGCIPATREFLRALREVATETGAVLIFDEVMTSRMSAGGVQRLVGVTPDVTTMGKYIGGGMSFGAFGGGERLMGLFDPRRADALPHAGTFNNNVLTMAAGVAGLSRVFTPEVAEALYRRGEDLRARLNAISPRMQWTGMGSLMCAHFTAGPIHSPADTARTPQALRDLFHFDLLERGFYLARRGMIALSLEVGEEELDRLVEAVGEIVATRGPVIEGATMGA